MFYYAKLELKEYKTHHNWVGNVIHSDLCKGLKFDHALKCFIHKPESARENETYKILRGKQITQSLKKYLCYLTRKNNMSSGGFFIFCVKQSEKG